jgi:hypothetical protein
MVLLLADPAIYDDRTAYIQVHVFIERVLYLVWLCDNMYIDMTRIKSI